MKTNKIMSIIGLVMAGIGVFVFYGSDVTYLSDAEGVSGWLMILAIWLVAQSVTLLVSTKKHKDEKENRDIDNIS